MIIDAIKNIKKTRAELRRFGITVGIVLGLLGGLLLWRGRDYYFYFLMFSTAFLFLGLIAPILLKPIHKAWMTLTMFLGSLITKAILNILFFLVVTPIGFLARIFGKEFLDTRFDRNAESYWIPRVSSQFDRGNYENQF